MSRSPARAGSRPCSRSVATNNHGVEKEEETNGYPEGQPKTIKVRRRSRRRNSQLSGTPLRTRARNCPPKSGVLRQHAEGDTGVLLIMEKAMKVVCVYLGVTLVLLVVVDAAPVSYDVASQRNRISPQAKGPVSNLSTSAIKGNDPRVNQRTISEERHDFHEAQETYSSANEGFSTPKSAPVPPNPFQKPLQHANPEETDETTRRSLRTLQNPRTRIVRSPVAGVIQEEGLVNDRASILSLPELPCPGRCEIRNKRGQCVLDFECLLRTHGLQQQ